MAQDSSLNNSFSQMLLRAWKHRGALAVLLLPIALIYSALLTLRLWLFRAGIFKSQGVECAVIVVGNIMVGGAGKTPTTFGIVQHLLGRGMRVGVVSRGYGRRSQEVRCVARTDDADAVGDEPLLLARSTGVPVFVGSSRYAAAKALLQAHPDTQVILCDDGLQHLALQRDIEVCVFDNRGLGNGWLLPSGPLRETWPRSAVLSSAGQRDDRLLVLHTGAKPAFAGYRAQRSLATQARAHDGGRVHLSELKPPLLALAGIAKPEEFFDSLRKLGLVLDRTIALSDHFDFAQMDTAQLKGHQVLCTEKDAVKLWKYWPQALAAPLIQTLEPAFLTALDAMLDQVLASKLSSAHGHQTA
jgi:tetraacyldisaccharide 4'-kinase